MDSSDAIWNRALGERTSAWGPGDDALSAALRFHSAAMSGGVLDAIETAEPDHLVAAQDGYEWLGLSAVSALILDVRSRIDAGALEDDDQAEELERSSDDQYNDLLPSDAALEAAFRSRLEEEPAAFAAT